MSVRVLIVDDHPAFREQARQLLTGDWEVIGEAGDGEQAMQQVTALAPSLVLLDVQLPDVNGFDLAEQITALRPGTGIVMTSARDAGYFRRRLDRSHLPFVRKDDLSAAALDQAVAS